MIYIETGSKDVYYNFALEDYIMTSGKFTEKVFLLWSTVPTLMVGNFQNIKEEIDEDYAKKKNIKIVRRQSGGGTIYTDEGGWQFSFWLPDIGADEIDFRLNASKILNALNKMGINAVFNERNDITVDGKKISGNARYVTKAGVLHHGSLLFDTDIEEMVKAVTVGKDKIISKGIKSIRQRVANLSGYIPCKMTSEEFKNELLKLILTDNDIIYNLTDEEICTIKKIADEKFSSWEWNYGNNPEFEIIKSQRFDGGKLEIRMNVKNGIIKNIKLCGDFFSFGNVLTLQSALTEVKYHLNDINNALNEKGIDLDHFFDRIGKDEFLELLMR